ncbi:metallophosphoesterase [Stenotrophomonas sp. SY1]|uniref:metallophosphoesterase n=1 Tax=Stenotrophomonas sp. SY1 TaxID=477235 RepID=UPI001E54E635|nr:metallophosphoesterase [Stenotrophomonas sp. SY1]MCD9087706.1 metallophosphoesterase [Stenotrophomonas sp. SY1]
MRLLVLSDLHREMWHRGGKNLATHHDPVVEVSQPDVVVLAGDIDEGDRAVAWADQTFPDVPVMYVSGNHEGYGHCLDSVQRKIATACTATRKMHYLNRTQVILEDVRFLGVTLWTDFRLLGDEQYPMALYSAAAELNDYRRIRIEADSFRRLHPLYTQRFHHQDRNWLGARLAEPFAGKTVVISHMAPSAQSIPDRYRGDLLSAAFASSLESLVTQPDLWIHGHVHDSVDYRIGRGRVVCNPRGYPVRQEGQDFRPENPSFDPNLIIEV